MDEFFVVGNGYGIDVDVEPGDEDGLVYGLVVFGSFPVTVKGIAYSFCGGFNDYHCVGCVGYSSSDGLHGVFGCFAVGLFPESVFGYVCEGYMLSSYSVGFFG